MAGLLVYGATRDLIKGGLDLPLLASLGFIEVLIGMLVLGFAISAEFAGWLKLSRHRFLVPCVILISIFLHSFFVLTQSTFVTLQELNPASLAA